jgi:multidrug efflux pump subunit AcrB
MFLRKVKLVMTAATVVAALAAGAVALAQSGIDRSKDGAAKPEHVGSLPAAAAAEPPMEAMYVNIFSTDEDFAQKELFNFANDYVMVRLSRIKGLNMPWILGNRISAMRLRLDPERMRAHNLSSDDVMKALQGCRMMGSPQRLGQSMGKTWRTKEYELTYIGSFNKPEQWGNIILKASPDGEILRITDVGKVELDPQFFDIYADINGHPAAPIVLKQAPGSNAAEVIESIKTELEQIKKESFPPGMDYEFLEASEDRSLIYVVVHTPPDSTLEYTNAKSHEVQAIAKGIEGVTSVSSYAGYEVLAEGRGANDGAFLIKLKKRSDRKLTSCQILELLAEKCRTISNVTLEFFEPAEVDELRGHAELRGHHP